MKQTGFHKWTKDMRFAWGALRKQPLNVLIQVTNRCNMKCSFCDFWPHHAKPKDELTLDDYKVLSEQLSKLGCFLISIEGGEPCVRKDIVEIIEIFSKHHLPVLYTNGWFITQEKALQMFNAGLHQVGISIDFASPEKHDAKRVKEGATDRAWQAIKWMRDAAPYKGAQVHVMTVLMEENRDEFEQLLEMSAEQQVRHAVTLLSLSGYRRAKGQQDQLPKRSYSEQLLTLWKKYPHFMSFHDYLLHIDNFIEERHEKLPTCNAGTQSMNIDHLGGVSVCIEKIDQIIGNVKEESIIQIYERLKAQEGIQQCQDCWTLCRGFSQMMSQGGSKQSWLDMFNRMRI